MITIIFNSKTPRIGQHKNFQWKNRLWKILTFLLKTIEDPSFVQTFVQTLLGRKFKLRSIDMKSLDLIDFHALSSLSKTLSLYMYSDVPDKSRVHCKKVCPKVLGKVLQFSLIVQKIVALCSYGCYRTCMSKFSWNITPSQLSLPKKFTKRASLQSKLSPLSIIFYSWDFQVFEFVFTSL